MLVFCALALIALLAMGGLVVDGGNLFLTRQRLQSACDAAALMGAQKLPTGNLTLAENAARFAFLTNGPGGDSVTVNVSVTADDVRVTGVVRYAPSLLAALGVRVFNIGAYAIAENRAAETGTPTGQNFFDPFGLGGSAGSLFGKDALTFSGNAGVDSYDSSVGSYSATKTNAGHAKTDGNFSTSGNGNINGTVTSAGTLTMSGNGHVLGAKAGGNITMSGNATVDGPAATNGSSTLSGNAQVNGSHTQGAGNAFPPTTLPPIDTSVVSVTNNNSLIPSSMKDTSTSPPSIDLSGNKTGTLPAGTYYITNLSITGNAQINIPSNVKIYVSGSITIGGNGTTNTDPNKLQFYYTGTAPLNFAANSTVYAGLYSPSAQTTLTGNSEFYGAIVAKSLSMSGNGNVHVDKGLRGFAQVTPGGGNTGPLSGGGVTTPAHYGLVE